MEEVVLWEVGGRCWSWREFGEELNRVWARVGAHQRTLVFIPQFHLVSLVVLEHMDTPQKNPTPL